MFKKILVAVVLCIAFLCLLGNRAVAQSTNCLTISYAYCTSMTLYSGPDAGCQPPLPANAFNCVADQFDGVYCQVLVDSCNVPRRWCPTCGQGGASAGNPINLTNGNTYIQETDIKLAGLGGGLNLVRTWNSMIPSDEIAYQSGMFGLQWRSTYEERVFSGSGEASGDIGYLQSDGGIWYFYNGSLVSPKNEYATLSGNGSTWTITFHDGSKKIFSNTSGSLTSIVDRNGNITNLTYDLAGRLTTVTDPASRHLYFTYQNGSSLLVTSVTSDFGVSTSYSYDSQGRLTQVTEPDQSTLSFQYNSQSLISSVLDSNGVVLESHTYDSLGRGLTSSRANGVDAVTVSYPQ